MNTKQSAFIILAILNTTFTQADALDDIDSFPCNSSQYLKCINVTNAMCKLSFKKASNKCYGSLDANGAEYDSIKTKIINKAPCFSDAFMDNLNKSDSTFKKCEHIITNEMDIIIEKAKKEKELSDKRFFEEDDHLHNYEKKPNN